MVTRRRLRIGVAAAAALAAALAVTAFLLVRPAPPSDAAWEPVVSTLAGDGVQGLLDGDAVHARFIDPFGVAVATDGTIYVADGHRIRRISLETNVSTHAEGFGWLSGLAIDPDGTLYAADSGNDAVIRIARDGTRTRVATDFNGPIGLALHHDGRIIVADTYNDRICAIDRDGAVSTVAGGGEPGYADGTTAAARFDTPSGVAVDVSGRIYVADTGNNVVRAIDPNGIVTTVGGASAMTDRPIGIAVGEHGIVYLSEESGRLRIIGPSGESRIAAGDETRLRQGYGGPAGFRDGPAEAAQFRRPAGLAVAAGGRIIVADAGNGLVRVIQASAPATLHPPAAPRVAPQFDPERFRMQPLLWPVDPQTGPHEIAGTLGEARGDEAERFHAGIDVRADEGVAVLAVRDGFVSSPIATDAFGSLDERLRIGDVAYVHIRAGRDRLNQLIDRTRFVATPGADGHMTRIRVKRGARFTAGEVIGTVNRFNHVHLNVGWPGEDHNPLRFRLAQFRDTVPPTIAPAGIRVFDEAGQPLTRRRNGRLELSGRVRVVVDAWDQIDGNRPSRRLGVYTLGYQVLMPDGTPAPGFERMADTLVFDRMPIDADAPRLVYAPGSGIPFYGNRRTRFLYTVTSTFRAGRAAEGVFDTTRLPLGAYILRIKAADFSGNEALRNRDLPVVVVSKD